MFLAAVGNKEAGVYISSSSLYKALRTVVMVDVDKLNL
jgi:hypothetical protein